MKKIIKNISIFSSYFLYEYIFIYLFMILNINFYNLDYKYRIYLLLGMNILFVIFLFFMFRKELKMDINDFKKNYKEYIKNYLWVYIVGIILMGASNIILQSITQLEMSGNESAVRSLIKKFPIYMIFSSIIYAPFVEEIIFRKTIKNIINNKYAFVIISGLLFGILHISDYKNINEILMGIPYIIMGLDFAYIFQKTKNICLFIFVII